MIARRAAWVCLVAGLGLLAGCVPAKKEEGDIVTNVLVNYGSAYKEKTWAPVDVLIKNDKRDVKGAVEIRLYSGDQLQSPVYRQPIDLPKGSQKRVQFHCFFNDSTRLAVQLFDGQRPVFQFPQELPGLRPIPENDLLCLALDEEGTGFSFLFMVLNPRGGNRGVHRETVSTAQFPFLSEIAQSYEPVDLVVLGDVDPSRLGERQRDLLYEYVQRGGVVAVCTGRHARSYRGTWVEDLLGVKIGPEAAVDEAVLAQEAFPEADRKGARPGRECLVAALEPQAPEVKRAGGTRTLATRRPIGSGYVYALAVDADSRALQECTGYTDLWREICTARRGVGGLNFDAVADYASDALPRVSGIVIHSKVSVITYLALYFLVAVVGNWMFFSWLKRREWAWAALVVFAIGFTAYAMYFGTTGRAQTTELHQVQVVQVPQGGGISPVDSFVGVLTAHTARYTLDFPQPRSVAEDLYYRTAWLLPESRGLRRFGSATSRPFTLVQGPSPRMEEFRIGASELRLARVRHDVELDGLEGALVLDEAGLHGDLVDRAGIPLEQPFLFYQGHRYDISSEGGRYHVEIPAALLQAPGSPGVRNALSGGFTRNAAPSALNPSTMRRDLPDYLFAAKVDPSGAPRDRTPIRTDVGPFLCGWTVGHHFPAATSEEALRHSVNETLIVADVALDNRLPAQARNRPLEAWVMGRDDTQIRYMSRGPARGLPCDGRTPVSILLPMRILDSGAPEIRVRVNWESDHGHPLVFQPMTANDEWPAQNATEQATNPHTNPPSGTWTFRIANWRDHLTPWNDSEFNREPLLGRDGPLPFLDSEVPVAVISGWVRVGQPTPQCGNYSRNFGESPNYVLVTAEAVMPEDAPASGEARWQ